jgi:uncharacterized protein
MNRFRKVCNSVAATLLFMSAVALHAGAQAAAPAAKPAPPPGKVPRHVLVIAQTHGFEHDLIPDAMAAVYNMGQQTGLWDTILLANTSLCKFRICPKRTRKCVSVN